MIAGEGRNELGGWASEVAYRQVKREDRERGCLEALLGKFSKRPFLIGDGVLWKRIRKYRAGGHRGAESRAMIALKIAGKERKLDAVAFLRDRDGDDARASEIERGVAEADRLIQDGPALVGGVPVRALEAWVLAVSGLLGTEKLSRPKLEAELRARGIGPKSTQDYVDEIDRCEPAWVAPDASSLHAFAAQIVRVFDTLPSRPAALDEATTTRKA